MLKVKRWLPHIIVAMVLAGCGGSGEEKPPLPEPSLSSTSSVLTPSRQSTPAPPTGPLPVETESPVFPIDSLKPDPSTAGSLNESSLPQEWLGFTPAVVDPSEGEFNPNGTWVHGQDATLIAGDALPPCRKPADLPIPAAALSGTYRNSVNAPGNGVALEFSSAPQARLWFEGYVQALRSCQSDPAGFEVLDIALEGGSTLRTLRDYQSMIWAERVWVEGAIVILIIVQGDFSLDQTSEKPR